jgi:hypothetical protein
MQPQEAYKEIHDKILKVKELTGIPLKLETIHDYQTSLTGKRYSNDSYYLRIDFESNVKLFSAYYNSTRYKIGYTVSHLEDIIMELDVILKFIDYLVAAQIAKKEPEEEDKEDSNDNNREIQGQPYIS